jgi:hypothetical protein
LDQPYWVIELLLGAALVGLPCVTIDKSNDWTSHSPTTLVPVYVGVSLILVSTATFLLKFLENVKVSADTGVDVTRVIEKDGVLSTVVAGCEVRVINGRIENFNQSEDCVIVLPCNEYFDDECAADTKSALGVYVNKVFQGQAKDFMLGVQDQCRAKWGRGTTRQKTETHQAESFGAGRSLLFRNPLGRIVSVALISTTTQRAGEGLTGRIRYMFEGLSELAVLLADTRIREIAMPVLGSGHGGIEPPLALVGLLLAVAEVARYGQGSQRSNVVTIVVYQKDENSSPQVDPVVVRRALALIGSRK